MHKMKMKKFFVISLALVLCNAMSIQAAGDEKNGHAYFTKAQLPNMANILPAPPEFESARFVADQSQYLWVKLMRLDEARCAQAKRDAVYSMATIIEEFGDIFGLKITKEDTPEIYTILQDVCASCDSIYSDAKAYFNRMRPYAYYNEGTIVPEKEEKHRTEGSYPSGHTVLGWTSALLLADINTSPKAMEGLLTRGYEFGQSRVIAGYHWQSDVDAGRMAGTVLYQMIRNHERFIGQLARARAEFTEKTGGASNVANANVAMQNERSAQVYRIDGSPASESTKGIVIAKGQKFVRK